MKSSTRVLGAVLMLILALGIFPITAGARGISNITGTQPEQRHGFDVGRPSVAQDIPGAIRESNQGLSGARRSTTRRHPVKKYASGRQGRHNSHKKAERKKQEDSTTVILSQTEPAKRVFVSKINSSDTTTQKDRMQTPKMRRVADFLMMGIAGFSILAAVLYVLTAHKNK